jgi:hypothetical protein
MQQVVPGYGEPNGLLNPYSPRQTVPSNGTLSDAIASAREAFVKPHENMAALATAIVAPILSIRPHRIDKIQQFQSRYSSELAKIQHSSWEALKLQEADMNALQEFRTCANEFISQLSIDFGRDLGLAGARWSSWGTVGFRSDVDITVECSNIYDAVQYKTLRDCLHTYVCGGLSGVQLDTESYIPHQAFYDISKKLHSQEAHDFFHTGEKACIFLQRYMSLGTDRVLYEQSKKRDLESIEDPEERFSMMQLLEHVEAWMQMLDGLTQEKMLTGLCYKEARELAFVPLRCRLGANCQNIIDKIQRETTERDQERLHLELQRFLIMLVTLQDQGTLSVAEGKVTIYEHGGQIYTGVVRLKRNSKSEFFLGSPRARNELVDKYPQFGRKLSDPLAHQLGAQEDGISDQFARLVLESDVEAILEPEDFARPKGLDFLMAAYEESMQLEHVVYEKLRCVQNPGHALVEAAKYALRVTGNLLKAHKEFDVKPIPTQAKTLQSMCEGLEKCKRRESISSISAAVFLQQAVCKGYEGRGGYISPREIEDKMMQILSLFDYGGDFYGKVKTKEEKVRKIAERLSWMRDWCIDTENGDIVNILKAHAGMDNTYHKEALDVTLMKYELKTEDDVKVFLEKVLALGQNFRNMARKQGHMRKSKLGMAQFFAFVEVLDKTA